MGLNLTFKIKVKRLCAAYIFILLVPLNPDTIRVFFTFDYNLIQVPMRNIFKEMLRMVI